MNTNTLPVSVVRIWKFKKGIFLPMKKNVEEINKMIMEDAPVDEIDDAVGYIDICSCFDPIFEPPADFLEECRKRWEAAQSSFRKTVRRNPQSVQRVVSP